MAKNLPFVLSFLFFGIVSVYSARLPDFEQTDKIHTDPSYENSQFDQKLVDQHYSQKVLLSRMTRSPSHRNLPRTLYGQDLQESHARRERIEAEKKKFEQAQLEKKRLERERSERDKLERKQLEKQRENLEKVRLQKEKAISEAKAMEASRRLRQEEENRKRAEKEHAKLNVRNEKKRWT